MIFGRCDYVIVKIPYKFELSGPQVENKRHFYMIKYLF